jgi:hypothetical protein
VKPVSPLLKHYPLEFTVLLIRGIDREILGIAAILRDVTARWEREKTMRAHLSALEGQA